MTRTLLVPLILALAGTACMHAGHSVTAAAAQPTTAAPATPAQGDMAGMCPMNVPGTRVSVAETPTGQALTFTTTPEQTPALREKVHAMADMHNRHHAGDAGHGASGGMHGGMMGGGTEEGGMEGMQMPPASRAAVEDLPDGARILVTPNDPAELDRLQKTVRMHAEHMQQHGCPMMKHPQG